MTSDRTTFIRTLTDCQSRVYGYALSLLGDPEAAADVLQETNLVLWKRAEEFEQIENYPAYALKVAYLNICNLRRRQRSQERFFDQETFDKLAGEVDELERGASDHLVALSRCLEKLPTHQRSLVEQRYGQNVAVRQLAQSLGRSAASLSVLLHRVRRRLFDCIVREVERERNHEPTTG